VSIRRSNYIYICVCVCVCVYKQFFIINKCKQGMAKYEKRSDRFQNRVTGDSQ
jgi:hypothetical protein